MVLQLLGTAKIWRFCHFEVVFELTSCCELVDLFITSIYFSIHFIVTKYALDVPEAGCLKLISQMMYKGVIFDRF